MQSEKIKYNPRKKWEIYRHIRLLAGLLPTKKDSRSEKIRKSVFLAALLVFIVSFVVLATYVLQGFGQNNIVESARKEYVYEDNEFNANGTYKKFNPLLEKNPDVKGWLTVPNTRTDNPVYQTDDNDFYITHNMNKEESRYGALFIDKAVEINREFTSKNIIIYGHNMHDGSMFGQLTRYKKLNFYKENPTITFDTLYSKGIYKIFAVFVTTAEVEEVNGEIFNYRTVNFKDNETFLNWIEKVRMRSILNIPVDVNAHDEILTLSTCSYDFDDARMVVVARRVRIGENSAVDTSTAVKNTEAYSVKAHKEETSSVLVQSAIKSETTVPELKGMSLNKLKSRLSSAGLKLGTVTYDNEETDEATVLSQSIPPGTAVEKETEIDVKINGKPKPVTVPNLVGETYEDALNTLISKELNCTKIPLGVDDYLSDGLVISQSPQPGTSVYPDTSVTLNVGKYSVVSNS